MGKRTKGREIWIAVIVILILIAASAVGVGTVLKMRSAGEKNVISLNPGEATVQENGTQSGNSNEGNSNTNGTSGSGGSTENASGSSNNGTGSQSGTNGSQNESESGTIISSSDNLPGKWVPAEEEPGMITEDQDVRWQIDTDIDLFQAAYANDEGEVTVLSDDGSKVIAPGTGKDYEFSLKNTGNISLDYTLSLNSMFQLNRTQIPVLIRLRSGDRWIVGSEDQWVNPDSLMEVMEHGTLGVNKYVTYTFEWYWPFETNGDNSWEDINDTVLGDVHDTILGNTAVTQRVDFMLTIITEAEVTPGAVPTDEDGNPLLVWIKYLLPPKTGDDSSMAGYLLLELGSAAIIILLLLLARRKVFLSGTVVGADGDSLVIDRTEYPLTADRRFLTKGMHYGKHRFHWKDRQGTGVSGCRFRLVKKRNMDSICFERKEDLTILTVGKQTVAIELYLELQDGSLKICTDKWALINKKHNVITPEGSKAPENGSNITPGGLAIDNRSRLELTVPKEAD